MIRSVGWQIHQYQNEWMHLNQRKMKVLLIGNATDFIFVSQQKETLKSCGINVLNYRHVPSDAGLQEQSPLGILCRSIMYDAFVVFCTQIPLIWLQCHNNY